MRYSWQDRVLRSAVWQGLAQGGCSAARRRHGRGPADVVNQPYRCALCSAKLALGTGVNAQAQDMRKSHSDHNHAPPLVADTLGC
jgi:hypothetical protein